MTVYEFVEKHRETINAIMQKELGDVPIIDTDRERELWVMNFEPLYRWAVDAGMDIEE